MQNVRVKQALLVIGWLVIAVLTVYASVSDPMGVFHVFDTPWSALITTDLTVELILISIFIYWDSKRRGKFPWIWIVVALILGAISTLGYLFVRTLDKDAPPLFGR